jgi:hypothetical protein
MKHDPDAGDGKGVIAGRAHHPARQGLGGERGGKKCEERERELQN